MTNISIDSESLSDTINFLVQYLRDAGYEGSVENGTAIHDTVIKPVAMLLDVFKQQSTITKAYLSLAEAEALKDTLGDEYDSVVDSILSNWFVKRKEGTPPKIKVQLFFSKAPDGIEWDTDYLITTISGLDFYPIEDTQIFSTDFIAHSNPYGGTEKYSIELTLVADTAGELPDNLLDLSPSFSVGSYLFLSGKILAAISSGTTQEDSDSFIARTEKAVTTRELISERAISTVLIDDVDEVTDVYVAGHGAAEQLRDIVVFQEAAIHVGNKVDIYVKTSLERVTVEYTLGSGSQIDFSNSDVLQVYSVTNTDDELYYFQNLGNYEAYTNSMQNSFSIVVPELTEGTTVKVTMLRSMGLSLPTEFIVDEDNRVGCYDPLVKEMFPVQISGTLKVELTAESVVESLTSEAEVLESIQDTVLTFINSLGVDDVFNISAMISEIHSNHSEVIQVYTPVELSYSILNPETFEVVQGYISSTFSLPLGLSNQVTLNTTQFYTDSSMLLITRI
jgi:hypothetical protein